MTEQFLCTLLCQGGQVQSEQVSFSVQLLTSSEIALRVTRSTSEISSPLSFVRWTSSSYPSLKAVAALEALNSVAGFQAHLNQLQAIWAE